MDTNNLFGEILETAGTAAKQTGRAVANAASATVQTAATQIGVPIADNSAQTAPSQDASSQVSNEDVVQSMYEKSQTQQSTNAAQKVSQQNPMPSSMDKTPQEKAEMEVVRKRLHDEYYQSLIHPPKQEEERTAEKVEREEKEEMVDLQKKEMENPPDLAAQRAAQRVEKFTGASG